MINGPARFTVHLDRLETLLLESARQPAPALWLYQNGARTPLFMLEGLAKLYGALHNKKRFAKMEERFKLVEDTLGAIDCYDAFSKEFAADKKTPRKVVDFARMKSLEHAASLDQILIDGKWIGSKADRLRKIRKQLAKIDWLKDQAELKAIESYYKKPIKKIDHFAKEYDSGFTDLESQVHELRRKLRWLSIYPQALQGCIQLTSAPSKDKYIAKYLTPEIVNSPFNKMPDAGANRCALVLNKDYFLALSWMIAELGKLKDQGLRILVLNEAGIKSDADAAAEAAILANASKITRTFFAEHNLGKLLVGVASL